MIQVILVTGGTGYLGRRLVEELLKIDKVRVFTRQKDNALGFRLGQSTTLSPASNKRLLTNAKTEIFTGNITKFEDVDKAMKGIDFVFHLAKWKGHNAPYEKHYPITVLGTENVMKAAVKNKVKKVIFMSTIAVTGKNATPYVRAKRDAEEIVKKYWTKIDAPVIRAALIYDKEKIKKLKRFTYFPFPYKRQKLRLSYKDSVIEALIGAMKYGKSKIYNVADKNSVTLVELFKEIARPRRILFVPWPLVVYPGALAAFPVAVFYRIAGKIPPFTPRFIFYTFEDRVFDISESVKELKYEPVDTIETIRRLKCE